MPAKHPPHALATRILLTPRSLVTSPRVASTLGRSPPRETSVGASRNALVPGHTAGTDGGGLGTDPRVTTLPGLQPTPTPPGLLPTVSSCSRTIDPTVHYRSSTVQYARHVQYTLHTVFKTVHSGLSTVHTPCTVHTAHGVQYSTHGTVQYTRYSVQYTLLNYPLPPVPPRKVHFGRSKVNGTVDRTVHCTAPSPRGGTLTTPPHPAPERHGKGSPSESSLRVAVKGGTFREESQRHIHHGLLPPHLRQPAPYTRPPPTARERESRLRAPPKWVAVTCEAISWGIGTWRWSSKSVLHNMTHGALVGISTHGALEGIGGRWVGRAGVGALLAHKLWRAYHRRRREHALANKTAHATLQAAFHRTRHPPVGLLHPRLGTRVGRNARHAALRAARRTRSPFPPPPPRPKLRTIPTQGAQGPLTFEDTIATAPIWHAPPPHCPRSAAPSPGHLVVQNGIGIGDTHALALYAVLRRAGRDRHGRGGRGGEGGGAGAVAGPGASERQPGHTHTGRMRIGGVQVWRVGLELAHKAHAALWRHAGLVTARMPHCTQQLWGALASIALGAARAYTVCKRFARAVLVPMRRSSGGGGARRGGARRRKAGWGGRALRVGLAVLTSGVRAAPHPLEDSPNPAAALGAPTARPPGPPAAAAQHPGAATWARALRPQADPHPSAPAGRPERPDRAPREKQSVHRLQLVSYNVGSIGGKTDSTSMQVFLNALRASRYDIALVQEHKIPEGERKKRIREAFSLGFLAVLSSNSKGKAKGGTGIFIRTTPDLATLEDIEGTHSLHGLNGGFTKASFLWEGERLEVASIYSPVTARPREMFLTKLAAKQRSATPPLSHDTVLGGDFNSVPDVRLDLTFPPMSPSELKARRAQYDNKHSDKLEDLLTAAGLEDILRARVSPRTRIVTRPGRVMAQHTETGSPNRQVSSRIDRFYVPTALPYEFHPGVQSADTTECFSGNSRHGKDLLFPSDHLPITLGISRPAGASRTKNADEHISRAALESVEGVAAVTEAAKAHFDRGALPGESPVDRWEAFKLAAASALVKVSAEIAKRAEAHRTSQEKEVDTLVADLHIVEEDFQHLHRDPEGQGKRFDILEKLASISRKKDVQKLGASATRHTFSSHGHGHFYLPFKPRRKATTIESLYTVDDWAPIQGGAPLPAPATATIATTTDTISSEVAKYYAHLYSRRPVEAEAKQAVLESIGRARIPDSLAQRAEGNGPEGSIGRAEVEETMKGLPRGSSPGPDLLGNEFYAIHRDILTGPLTEALNHASRTGALPSTMLQGSISVLYKKKDRKDIRNYRPITLLNCDYKILTRILNTRILKVLRTAAAVDNTGFVPGRSILDNTRLLTLLQAVVEEREGEGAMIFLDFEKAFDTVSHELLVEAIDRMGFGPDFKRWVGLLYNPESPPQRRTVSNGKRSAYWSVQRGVAQGCPLSPALYLVVAEALTRMANDGVSYRGEHLQIEGIEVGDLHPFRVSQFADDTVMLLANTGRDLDSMWKVVEVFERGTGMRVNKAKTEGLQLGRSVADAAPSLFANTGAAKYTTLHSATHTRLNLSTAPRGSRDPRLVAVTRVHPSPQEAARALTATSGARHRLPFRALLRIPGPQGEPYYCLNATEAARDIVWCEEGDWIVSLGVPIGRSFDPGDFLASKVGEIRALLTRWNGRLARVPTASRVQLVNSLLLSRIWYWAPVLRFPKHITTQLTTLASKTIWAKDPRHDTLRTPSPGRWKPWIRRGAAGRRKALGGLGVVDIRSKVAAAQADSVVRLFDHGTGRWKEVLLHLLSRASRGAPYGRDLLLSLVPTSAIQRALSGPWLSFWREAIGHFHALEWQTSTAAGPEARCSSLVFADRDNPPPTVRDPRVWERTLGIVRARDTYLVSERRFKTFQEVLGPWRVGRDPDAIPKDFRRRRGLAELNGEGGLEPRGETTSRIEREWATIVTAVRASHGDSLRAIGDLPEAGSLVAMGTERTQQHGGKWIYGHRVGPAEGGHGTSMVIRILLGPNGLQTPHSSPTPIEVSDGALYRVATIETRLGRCILGPEGHTHPHPDTWILASRGSKVNTKTPPSLHSRRIGHIYTSMQKNAHQAPASEKRWERELARSSTHRIPALRWALIYRGTHPALLTPADSQQMSKMVHRGTFTNAARGVQEERGCRLGCGRISNPIEHMSHLATCRKTARVRLWALQLISAIGDLPALPWAHGLVPFFCLGLAPPPVCTEDCQGIAGCTCLTPLSAGGYAVLTLTLRHLYAALTRLAIEELPSLAQPQIIKTIAEALRDRISSFFALTRRRLIAAENRSQDLDIGKEVRGAGGGLLSADEVGLAIHPAAHLALKDAGAEMPRVLRWRYSVETTSDQQPPRGSSATHLDPTEDEEETQRGPAAAPRGLTGAGEATQGGWEATEAGRVGPVGLGPGAALRSADAAAQELLSRPSAQPQSTPPRRSTTQARRSPPQTPPAPPSRSPELGGLSQQTPPVTSPEEATPQPRGKRQRRRCVVLSPDTLAPAGGPRIAPHDGPRSPAPASTPSPARRRGRDPEVGCSPLSTPASPSIQQMGPRNGPLSPAPTPTPSPTRRRARSPALDRSPYSNPASPGLGSETEAEEGSTGHGAGDTTAPPAPPTTAGFPFRLPEHRAASTIELSEIISQATLEAALERLGRSELRRMNRLLHPTGQIDSAGSTREVTALRRTVLCHKTLHLFRAGAEWDGHHGTATTRYSQPGGVGRHIAQHTQIEVEAIGPGLHPTASLGRCPREVRTLLTCPLLLDLSIANALPCIASQLDRLGLVPSKLLGALHTYSQDRDACLTCLIAAHQIGPLDQQTPSDIAEALANSVLLGASYDTWTAKYAAALGNTNHREGVLVRLQHDIRHIWAAVEGSAGGAVRAVEEEGSDRRKKAKPGKAHVFSKVLHEVESCILHTASHFLSNAGWTVHSMQQDSDASVPLSLLVRPPARLRPEQGDRPGRELVIAAEAALSAIARQTSESVAQPPPQGLGLDVTLAVKKLYGLDPETILRSFD